MMTHSISAWDDWMSADIWGVNSTETVCVNVCVCVCVCVRAQACVKFVIFCESVDIV